MPFISITTTGMALTVIREATISPVLCMILPIEALKTQIDGPTLSRIQVVINRITTYSHFMERTNSEGLSSAPESIHAVSRWDIVMR